MKKNSKSMWRVLPLCLIVFAMGLTSCDDALEAGADQDRPLFSFLSFLKTIDVEESDLMDKDQLPEWLVPIVNEREENDPSTAVFTAEMYGELVYNIYYFSKMDFSMDFFSGSLKYKDLYYSDGTPVPFKAGPECAIAFSPEEWSMIYCARPDLYKQQDQENQEVAEKDALPD